MGPKSAFIFIVLLSMTLIPLGGTAQAGNDMMLGLCQELMSKARSYEARAASHARSAKMLMGYIENTAKQPNNQGTNAAVDNYFAQYDQHRAMETKFMDLYRKTAEQAKQCMKSVE